MPRRGRWGRGGWFAVVLPAVVSISTGAYAELNPHKHQSQGSPNDGSLVGAKRWHDTKYAKRLAGHFITTAYAMPGLIALLDHAAEKVASRFPRSTLGVGDFSLEHGGPISGHHSHQNGRDVDVAYYAVDDRGKPLKLDHLVGFDAQGRGMGEPGVHFDDARNWAFVHALLSDPRTEVRSVFIASWLRTRLLTYAAKQHATRSLLEHAAMVMMQPPNAEPHHDHFHIRIACVSSQREFCHDDSIARPESTPHASDPIERSVPSEDAPTGPDPIEHSGR